MSPCEDEGVGGGDGGSWNRICWLGSAQLQENVSIPQHIKEALGGGCLCERVQQLSEGDPPPFLPPHVSVWFIYPARGNAGVQGRGTTHICCDYQMWEGETSLLQGPHPTVGKSIIPDTGGADQALSFANQSTFSFNQCPSPRETPSLMSFFCSTGILLGRVQKAAGPGGEIRRQLKAEHQEAEFKACKRLGPKELITSLP